MKENTKKLILGIAIIGIVGFLWLLSRPICKYDFHDEPSSVTRTFIDTVPVALIPYRIDVGEYPSTTEGLRALVEAPKGKEEKWKGPYLKELPLDPWSNPYQYRYPGVKNEKGSKGYDLWSFGPDGVISDDDTTNWKN